MVRFDLAPLCAFAACGCIFRSALEIEYETTGKHEDLLAHMDSKKIGVSLTRAACS